MNNIKHLVAPYGIGNYVKSTVDDVQVNGTSIVNGGVANVPIISTTAFGLSKTSTNNGVKASSGVLSIRKPTSQNISDRNTWANKDEFTITLSQIDETVKKAMTDGVGASWTTAEQQAAQIRLGILSSEGVEF